MSDIVDHLKFFAGLGVTHLNTGNGRKGSSPVARGDSKPPAAAPTDGQTAASLREIREDLGDCRRCKLCGTRKNIVFGVGDPNADLMFVGEAPGADEDQQGEPFVGKAGQLLTKIIETMFDLKRGQVYIANIIKCRPPGNRDPEPDEVQQCEPFLFRQIETVQPKIIVALGRVAAQTLLKSEVPISRLRGQFFDYRGRLLLPTFHPSYLLRTPSKKREVFNDMKAVRARLEELGSSYYPG